MTNCSYVHSQFLYLLNTETPGVSSESPTGFPEVSSPLHYSFNYSILVNIFILGGARG